MDAGALVEYMQDTIGSQMAGVLGWTDDAYFLPAMEAVYDRMGVESTANPYEGDPKQSAEWRVLVKAHARLAIWERVRDHTASFHYVLMPDGISAQFQQIHAQAKKLAAEAEAQIPDLYSIEISYLRAVP